MSLVATYLGANGWLLEIGSLRILVDPWLRGMLTSARALVSQGRARDRAADSGDLGLLLHAQGLLTTPTATLRLLRPAGDRLGGSGPCRDITRLHQGVRAQAGETNQHQQLTIRALPAHLPPTWRTAISCTIRRPAVSGPHGFLDPSLPPQPLDAVITPMVDLGLRWQGPSSKAAPLFRS